MRGRSAAPEAGAPAFIGRRPSPAALLVFATVVLLSVTVVVVAVLVRSPLQVVQVAGGLAFLEDPQVTAILREEGLEVRQTQFGTRQAAAQVDLADYDLIASGSAVQARLVERQLGPNVPTFQWFSSPMVILTSPVVAELLRHISVAEPSTDGTWRFKMDTYLREVSGGRRWDKIDGAAAGYPNPNRMLVSTTDPELSNSAAMFIAIAGYLLNGGDVPADADDVERVLPALKACFAAQGSMATRTPDLMNAFLVGGAYAVPMALVYENDMIAARRRDPRLADRTAVMYPAPNVMSENTLTLRTDLGRRLGELLAKDERLRQRARYFGYRNASEEDFAAQMAADGIVVGRDLWMIQPPAYQILNRLIDGVKPG